MRRFASGGKRDGQCTADGPARAQTGIGRGDVRKRHGRVHVVVQRGVQRAFADAANDLVVRLRFVIAVAIDAEGMGGEEGIEPVVAPRVPAVDANDRAGVQKRQGGVGVLRVADGVDDAVYAVREGVAQARRKVVRVVVDIFPRPVPTTLS